MKRMPQWVLDTIKKTPLKEVVAELLPDTAITSYLGRDIKIICPFHSEKTPSFNIRGRTNRFKCFGCGEGGSVIDFVKKIRPDLSEFRDAAKYLATRFHPEKKDLLAYLSGRNGHSRNSEDIKNPSNAARAEQATKNAEIKYDLNTPDRSKLTKIISEAALYFQEQLKSNQSLDGKLAREYLAEREIDEKLIERMGVGFAPNNEVLFMHLQTKYEGETPFVEMLKRAGLISENGYSLFGRRITFPVKTSNGTVLGFMARKIEKESPRPKYKNTPQSVIFNKERTLFGMEHVNREVVRREGIYIVEGMTDIIGFLEQNLECCVSIGSARITHGQTSLVYTHSPPIIYVVGDGDHPGITAAIANANRLVGTKPEIPVKIVSMPDGKDPFDVFHMDKVPANGNLWDRPRRIKKYVEQEAMTPVEFIRKNALIIPAGFKGNMLETFLADNTYHLLERGQIERIFGRDIKVRESKFRYEEPHPFLIEA